MSGDPDDRLVELALDVTDGAAVDWAEVRTRWPDAPEAVEALELLSRLAAVHAPAPGDDVPSFGEARADAVAPGPGERAVRWGPLELRQWLGAGSFGDVYVAWDPRLEREVALKLHRGRADDGANRWLEEARRLARVRHPNVVAIHGADRHDGRAGMWMELVRGRTLEARLQREGPLGAREAALIGIDLCGALAAVHAAGLAHGDVKTGNVVREGVPGETRDAGRLVLMDFGSARDSGDDAGGAPGTPRFTAPEVLAGGRATEQADVWSLGVVLHRLVTGAWPWPARDLAELRERIAAGPPVPMRSVRPDLPDAFIAAVERALERDPARRWTHAAELERALLPVLAGERHSAARVRTEAHARRARARLVVGASIMLALIVGAAVTARQGRVAWWEWRARHPVFVATTRHELRGTGVSEQLGHRVLDLGDFDGDGHRDLLVGAPGATPGGAATLATLAADGSVVSRRPIPGDASDSFGSGLAGPADFNADGYPDVAIASSFDDGAGRDAGRVDILFGGPGSDTRLDVEVPGRREGQFFGFGLSAGDVNGDLVADLIVGAPLDRGAGVATGRAYVYFGGPGMDGVPDMELANAAENGQFGTSVLALPDFNGDGHGDFMIGANYEHAFRGRAYLYWGGPQVDDRPDLVIDGEKDGEQFGVARSPCGDLNGDGIADLAVSRERADGLRPRSGAISIFFGGPAPGSRPDLVIGGERPGDGFGIGLDATHDVDGDGAVDLVVGAPWFDGPGGVASGRVYVYRGGRHLDDVPDLVIDGPSTNAWFGWSLAVLPDLDADGFAALAIGAVYDSRSVANAGSVRIVDLARWAVLASPKPWVAGATATLGWTGAVPARVALSTDRGVTWREVAARAGGRPANQLSVPVPAAARDSVDVRWESLRRDAPAMLPRRFAVLSPGSKR